MLTGIRTAIRTKFNALYIRNYSPFVEHLKHRKYLDMFATNHMTSLSSTPLNRRTARSAVNLLISFAETDRYCNRDNDVKHLFNSMKTAIRELIGLNKYTIYNVSIDDIKRDNSWHLNTALVILIGSYNDKNGNALPPFDGSVLSLPFDDIVDENQSNITLNKQYFKHKIISYLNDSNNTHINDEICENIAEMDCEVCYLMAKDNDSHYVNAFRDRFKSDVIFIDTKYDEEFAFNKSKLNVVINGNLEKTLFDATEYYSHLKTTTIGHLLVFAGITSSTMTLIEPFSGLHGFVAIANQQTKGRGRNENEWLSPNGCAMFTIQLSVSLGSQLGQRLGFAQHLAALAVVLAIKSISGGYENLDIRVKWPNDIYCNESKSKISGILVTSVLRANRVNILIGCGVNVFNCRPSLCLNDIIDDYNSKQINQKLKYISREELIARTLTQLETFLQIFEQNDGYKALTQLYLKHWMHFQQSVRLTQKGDKGEKLATIEGIDNQGYLLVRDQSDGQLMSVHPDGNRFDMIHNLTAI